MTPTLQIYPASTDLSLPLPYADEGVRAGFPSPAQDYLTPSFDLNREIVRHPAATFYARVAGDSMSGEGITEGDLLVIDRSLEAAHGDLAVCCIDGEFTLKRLRFDGPHRVWLMPSNPTYKPIEVTPESRFKVWGIVTHTIKANRRRRPGTEKW